MHAAILYDLQGDVDEDEQLESKLDSEFPAVDAEGTHYLGGQTLYHGQAAARIYDNQKTPMPMNNGIETETMEVSRRVLVDFYADLQDGWAGISSSDGEWFVDEYLLRKHGLNAFEMKIDLERWLKDFEDEPTASVWGVTYSVEAGDETTRAGGQFHRDASLEGIEREDVSGVGFSYEWGQRIRGVIYESGYVALYTDDLEEYFGKWLSEHILPYCVTSYGSREDDIQTTLGSGENDATNGEEGQA